MKIDNNLIALQEAFRTYFRKKDQDKEVLRKMESHELQKRNDAIAKEEVILYNRECVQREARKGKNVDIEV